MAEVDGCSSFPTIILSPEQFFLPKIFREKDTNINILNARCFSDRVFAVCCQTKFMFVSAWHLYSQELLIFYLLHPFCSSKADYNWVIGCCSHPGSSIHKQCCPHSQDQIPCVQTLLGHWGRAKLLPQLSEFTDLSVCMTRNSFGLYPERDCSVIF